MNKIKLNAEDKTAIQKIIKYAKDNIIVPGPPSIVPGPPSFEIAGDNPERVLIFRLDQNTFKVVFSYEKQPSGLYRHISVSKVPVGVISSNEVDVIADNFGFNDEYSRHMWIERKVGAINYLQKVENDEL